MFQDVLNLVIGLPLNEGGHDDVLTFLENNMSKIVNYNSQKDAPTFAGKEALKELIAYGNPHQRGIAIKALTDGVSHGLQEENDAYLWLGDLVTSKVPYHKEAARYVIYDQLKDFGFNATEVLTAWNLSDQDHTERSRLIHFTRLYKLERELPGIGKYLADKFGVLNFARYPKEILTRQYEQKDMVHDKYGLVIYAKDDHNGALSEGVNAYQHMVDQLPSDYPVKVYEISGSLGLVDAVNDSRRFGTEQHQEDGSLLRQGNAEFLFIGGHGNPEDIQFGNNRMRARYGHNISVTKADVQRKGAKALSHAFTDKSSVILISCSTGQMGGIGEAISKLGEKGVEVIAPSDPTNVKDIHVRRNRSGKLDFDIDYTHNAKEHIFVQGTLISVVVLLNFVNCRRTSLEDFGS